eukprot:10607155-Lingulodinium_polyedra.AAC.1
MRNPIERCVNVATRAARRETIRLGEGADELVIEEIRTNVRAKSRTHQTRRVGTNRRAETP